MHTSRIVIGYRSTFVPRIRGCCFRPNLKDRIARRQGRLFRSNLKSKNIESIAVQMNAIRRRGTFALGQKY